MERLERLRYIVKDKVFSLRRELQDRLQRSNAETQSQVELSLFAVLAGINPKALGLFPEKLLHPLEYKTISHLINQHSLLLADDTNTLEELTDRLLGLVDPQKRSIIYGSALRAAADILEDQLRHTDDPAYNIRFSPDFTKAASRRLQFIQGLIQKGH